MALTTVKGSVWDSDENHLVTNIKDLGAVGDGTTDDTTVFDTAIALGGAIYLPAGTYKITTFTKALLSNTVLFGDGPGISTIKFTSTTENAKVDFSLTNSDVVIRDLTIQHDGPSIADSTCDTTVFDTAITMDSTALISAGMTVSGDGIPAGATVSSVTNSTEFELSTNATATASNVTLTFESETAQIIGLFASNITVKNCEIYSPDSATVNTAINAFSFGNYTTDNLVISECHIHNVNRIILRDGAKTGDATNVIIDNNYAYDLGEGGFQFNFPNGTITGVQITNNRLGDFYSGSEQVFCGGSCLTNAVIANNSFFGTGKEGVHLEEGAENVVISDNVFDFTDLTGSENIRCIWLSANDIGDPGVTWRHPVNITISGNIMKTDSTTTGTNSGIDIPVQDQDEEQFENLIISNNIFHDFKVGIRLWDYTNAGNATSIHDYVISDNTFVECTTGIESYKLNPQIDGNRFNECTTALVSKEFGGMVGKNTFRGCTTVANTNDGVKIAMRGFIWQLEEQTSLPGTTTTYITMTGLGVSQDHIYGTSLATLDVSSTLYQRRLSDVDFTTSTLQDTQLSRVGSGTVSLNGMMESGGVLKYEVNNTGGSAVIADSMMVNFDGMWVSAG